METGGTGLSYSESCSCLLCVMKLVPIGISSMIAMKFHF